MLKMSSLAEEWYIMSQRSVPLYNSSLRCFSSLYLALQITFPMNTAEGIHHHYRTGAHFEQSSLNGLPCPKVLCDAGLYVMYFLFQV